MKKKINDLESLDEMINLSEEQEKAKPYLEKFNKAKTFNSSRQEAYAENMAFYQGNQHLLKKYKNETPWVVNMNTPYATIAIDNRVSSLLANDYIGELLPLSEEDVTPVTALSNAFQKEWKRMNIDDIVRACVRGGAVVREFYCHIVVDKNKTVGGKNSKNLGRIEAYAIEPSRIYIDPSARCLRDARYMFVTGRISKEEASERYPKIKSALQVSNTFTPQDRGEVYLDNDYVTSQDDVFTTLTYYGKENGKIKRVKLVNGIIVEEKVMPNRNFPILQFRWKKAAQSCYGLSLMDEVLSLQKAITSIESAITNTAMSYAAPSMMVRKGCGVDPRVVAKANGAPGVVYSVEGNLDNAIKPVIPPKIQQEILNIKTDFQEQIDKITGNSNQFLGDIGTAGNTSSGATIAVERAKIIEVDVLNNIREFVEDITEVLVEFISLMYGNETLTYNAGKNADGTFKFDKVELPDKSALVNSNYQYYIELETKTPYSKEKQKQLLLEIYQLERQYDTAIKTVTVGDIIKNTDLENKEEIISRFGNLTFQDAMTKTETIRGLIQTATSYGASEELLNSAIAEIIAGQNDTPAVDQLMSVLEDAFKQEMQKNDQNLSNAVDLLMSSPSQQAQVESMANELAPSPEMLGLATEQPQE
jgi:hypothetical protein